MTPPLDHQLKRANKSKETGQQPATKGHQFQLIDDDASHLNYSEYGSSSAAQPKGGKTQGDDKVFKT